MDWENTLDSTSVIEYLSKDTVVVYQVHKRVWPASQRDSLFWSTIRHCPADDDDGPDYWIVANHMTDHPNSPVSLWEKWQLLYQPTGSYRKACQPGGHYWDYFPGTLSSWVRSLQLSSEDQGPVLLLRQDAVARILANGSAAFFESCAAIGWKACDSVRSL